MTARTVTVTVQLGAGGFAIARAAAEQLGLRYHDWEITSQAAKEAGVSPEAVASADRLPSLVERVLDRYFSSGFIAGDLPETVGPTSITMDSALQTMTLRDYREMIKQVVTDLGEAGNCLIVGHSAQVYLKDRNDVLKVLIHGDRQSRAMRLTVEEGLSRDEALKRIKSSDADRDSFFRHYYHVDWLDAGLYDLTINTSAIQDDIAVGAIVRAAQQFHMV